MLKSILGVEIFSAGTWNGDTYTEQDLDEMVRAFNETSATCRPPLKLGHDDNQKMLQEDGLPAAGWIGRLYRMGEKLVADFVDIPEKIYQLIENKAYRNVSSEIYWQIDMGEKQYDKMLAAVALLGADMPAVSNLKDIMAMYKRQIKSVSQEKCYELKTDAFTIKVQAKEETQEAALMLTEKEKFEAEIKEYQAKLEAKETALADKEKELETATAKAKEYEAQVAESQKKEAEAKLELEVEGVIKSEGACEGMKSYVKELLGEEKKVYKFKAADKEIEASKSDLLKEVIKLAHATAKLSTQEQSEEGQKLAQGKDIAEEISAFEKENKVSYAEAYKAVCKKHGIK